MSAFERSMIRLTWAAVIVSVLSALVFGGQLYEMIAGGTATDKLVRYSLVQANAAGDQADAAQQFSDTAEDINERMSDAVEQLEAAARNAKTGIGATQEAMRLDQRAWVSQTEIGPVPELDKPWDLIVFFRNTGKTPAQRVYVGCAAEPAINETAIRWGTPSHFEPEVVAPNAAAICILHPITQLGTTQPKVTQNILDALQREEIRVYVYGAVVYKDVFRQWHWATFCKSMSSDGKAWFACEKGNDTGDGKVPPKPFDRMTPKPN